MVVQFKQWSCTIKVDRYVKGKRISLSLLESETSELVAFATVNMPDVPLSKNCVLIKNYGGNEGMTEALVKAGVVIETGISFNAGFPGTRIDMCELVDPKLLNSKL